MFSPSIMKKIELIQVPSEFFVSFVYVLFSAGLSFVFLLIFSNLTVMYLDDICFVITLRRGWK